MLSHAKNEVFCSDVKRGQIFEAEAEDKILASRTAWPRGLNITGILYRPP